MQIVKLRLKIRAIWSNRNFRKLIENFAILAKCENFAIAKILVKFSLPSEISLVSETNGLGIMLSATGQNMHSVFILFYFYIFIFIFIY